MLVGDPSVVFRQSEAVAQKLRIALMVDGRHVPAYARAIIEDLKATPYVQLVAVYEFGSADSDLVVPLITSLLLRAYARLIDSRYQAEPDPLAITDLSVLLSDVPCNSTDRNMSVDVVLNFCSAAADERVLANTRCGVWRYKFGDSRKYSRESAFLQELIDRNPLSAIELVRQMAGSGNSEVLCRAEYSTSVYPSLRLNQFAPIWGARHFMLQKLWELHNLGPEALAARSEGNVPTQLREQSGVPRGNWQLVPWISRLGLSRLWRCLRPARRPVHWKLAVRRSVTPLYEEAGRAALDQFLWLETPRGHDWADPFLFEQAGQTWIFFEELDRAIGKGHITCGRLTVDGALVDVKPVLSRPYHLSYPQIIAEEGEIFLLPEAAESGGLELYRAISFPDRWVMEKRLLDFPCVDSTVFRSASGWKMYTSPVAVAGHAPITWTMRAKQLRGPWQYDSQGPVSSSAGSARGAGNIVQADGRHIRPSQDCAIDYGRALIFNEIFDVEGSRYFEREVARIEGGWLPQMSGVHTYNRCGTWEVIDGKFSVAAGS